MTTREELLYEAFKASLTRALAKAEEQTAKAKDVLSRMLGSAQTVRDSLDPVHSNPLLVKRLHIRKLIHPLIATSNLLEICVDSRIPALVRPLKEALSRIVSDDVVLVGTDVATDAAALPRTQYRTDQFIVSQRIEIRTSSISNPPHSGVAKVDEKPLSLVVHQTFFLKLRKGQSPEVRALNAPTVLPDSEESELVATALEFKLAGMVFANELKFEVPLKLPEELAKQGLSGYVTRLTEGVVRIYYSSRRAVPPSTDAPHPTSPSVINIKLTRQLFDDMFRPKVSSQMGANSIGMERFRLSLLETVQLVRVEIVGSQRVSQYVGNVKFWGKGFARVVQLVKLAHTFDGKLQIQGEGDPQLLGDPWVGEAGAHMDTAIGGGIGVSLPDEAVDILWGVAKALRIGLPVSLPKSTVNEVLELAPQRVLGIRVRNSDALLFTQ